MKNMLKKIIRFLKKFLSRKFIYSASVFLTATYMLHQNKIDGWQWLSATVIVGSVYQFVNWKEYKEGSKRKYIGE